MTTTIRWGILGTGNIAHQFAKGLESAEGAVLCAVGSRSQETADRFGDTHGIPRRHASYEALANDPELDVIYIATPHPMHKDNSILCLDGGKAVLCEKPFTINQQEAAALAAHARARNLFLMEAMWTRFLPAIVQVRRWLAEGVIGEVRLLQADFGFRADWDPEGRLFNPELGGGALLDVGIYPVSFTSMVLGKPEEIVALAHLGETGVDEQGAFLLGYPEGRLAVLSAALRTQTPTEAVILGTEGQIRLAAPFYRTEQLTLVKPGIADAVRQRSPGWLIEAGRMLGLNRLWKRGGRAGRTFPFPLQGNGYNYEAAEVMRCLRAGQLESEVMPLDETLSIMETLDEIRARWGLVYPAEEQRG